MGKTYDIPLRDLVKDIPVNFLRLVFGKEFNSKGVKFLDVKLPRLFEREADLILEYKDEIYHLEVQSTDDPKMGLRMLHYYALILENYGKEPYQAVVYVGERPLKRMKAEIETNTLKFGYKLIDINRLDCSYLINSSEPSDWVLAVLCKMDKEERDLKNLLRKFLNLPKHKREKLVNFLLHIAKLRPRRLNLLLREVENMPITIDIERDPLYLKGLKKGLEEGIEKGLKEGIEKKAKQDVINLYKRLNLPPKQIAEILELPKEKVIKWLTEEGLL
jgi:predicted transposase YdaD